MLYCEDLAQFSSFTLNLVCYVVTVPDRVYLLCMVRFQRVYSIQDTVAGPA